MGGRDHSYECETCGELRGGINDALCACDDLPYEQAAALRSTIFPCSLCGGRVKPWLQPPGATAHSSCTWFLHGNLHRLSHNLAIAAGLCRAHMMGGHSMMARLWSHEPWDPGCGRAAP